MPPVLLQMRCALAAPFHPYLIIYAGMISPQHASRFQDDRFPLSGIILAVYFLLHYLSYYYARALPGTMP